MSVCGRTASSVTEAWTGVCWWWVHRHVYMVTSSTQDWGRASRHLASCRPTPRVRYTVLTGAPPFTVAPLSEMYRNIRDSRYPEPAHLSPSARRLIARLLAPNPAERPSLDQLLQDDFFTQVRAAQRAARPGGPGLGRGRPRCVVTPGAPPGRASLQTGCQPTLAMARPSSPRPSLWADSSGRWASRCRHSARSPVSSTPARPSPALPCLGSHLTPVLLPACSATPRLWHRWTWAADAFPLHGARPCPLKLLVLPQAPSLPARPPVQEKMLQILSPWSVAVR